MAAYQPGLTFTASPQAIRIVRERLERSGLALSESGARSLVEAILAVEGPRMQTLARGILHGSLETIRQTAEVALTALKENREETPDLLGVVREHLGAAPLSERRRLDPVEEDDPRPVFKRRGR